MKKRLAFHLAVLASAVGVFTATAIAKFSSGTAEAVPAAAFPPTGFFHEIE